MTKHLAQARCRELWHHLGLPFTRTRHRSDPNRFEVGYLGWLSNHIVVMGAGPTWEAAFEHAGAQS